jgi:cysteine sulfinate desulfinase/cysteine desulfurase-like protein
VLRALGHSPERVRGALRFGIGRGNDAAQIDAAVEQVAEAVAAQGGKSSPAISRARGG